MGNNRTCKNFMELEFPSLSMNTEIAKSAISVFARQMTPTPDQEDIYNITTAVNEAVQNAIIHAYPSFLGIIRIRARIYNGNILRIEVKDKGPGIPNVTEALKPAFTTANGRSGIGFTIMKSFMTTLNVHSTPGKGTTVTMEYHTGQSKETGDLA